MTVVVCLDVVEVLWFMIHRFRSKFDEDGPAFLAVTGFRAHWDPRTPTDFG